MIRTRVSHHKGSGQRPYDICSLSALCLYIAEPDRETLSLTLLEPHEERKTCSRCGSSSFGVIMPVSDNDPIQLICACCGRREPLLGS